ncbi:fungal-specific transcription factor domain-containing protein [Paraphoma chrysanthemicola]|uniref:Fungal-specific transcription factor domain-containing protein n=1 Tax=Paraphoma chrysanthemicola TaxID=798071 RepID=A0A8K0QSH0_9PLEO|nr:fungal-specific transcription factor domain-containing protein [Paraphoma chrysanthemicola]
MATHKRTRTGCWTCREAGYKCDEQKPHCGRCMRLKITCKGYGVKLKWQDGNTSTPTKKPRRAKRKSPVLSESNLSSDSGANFESNSFVLATPSYGSSSPDSIFSLPVISLASPPRTAALSVNDRWLLHYWVMRLSTLISVAPRKEYATPFQLHLTAMVHESAALRSTILSMAANHLSLSSQDPSLRYQAYRHQQDAIHELQTVIQDPSQAASEPALATVLMMQLSGKLFGNDDDASVANHLAGAKAMIARRGSSSESTSSTANFLLSLFAYHDILASVSRGSQPLADHEHDFAAVEGEADMQSVAQVLLTVARISQLQHAIKARQAVSTATTLSEEEDATGRDIQQTLLSMCFQPGNTASDIVLTAEAYRHAAFIYLYRTWLSIGAPNPITMDHVTRCLSFIRLVSVTSPLTSAHIWPLFTAGCEAIDVAQREFVRVRFEDMYAEKRFPSLRRVLRDVQHVWVAKDAEVGRDSREKVDCIQVILRSRGREVDLA